MSEHWDFFWKNAPPKSRQDDTIRMATTTDTAEDFEDAVHERVRANREPTFTYVEMQPAERDLDGSTEHSEPFVLTDVAVADSAEDLEDMLAPLTPQQAAIARANYQVQVVAARSVLPDFDEVVGQDDVDIPETAAEMIRRGGLPNAPLVAYYLGQHRQECERLHSMSEKAIQARITELSAKLAINPIGAALDKAPYAVYRQVRNAQARGR